MRATINGKRVTDRESLFALLQQKLNLPADCGKNLDAVYDVLTDPGNRVQLLWDLGSLAGLDLLGLWAAARWRRLQ